VTCMKLNVSDPLATWCCLMSHGAVGAAASRLLIAVSGVAYQIAVAMQLQILTN